MRPVTLYEKPPFPPYVCVYCGVGDSPRKWFIDPGLSLDYYFNPVNDGTPFICNECWENLRVQVDRQITNYNFDKSGWDSPDRVAASYDWKEKLSDVRGQLTTDTGGDADEFINVSSGVDSEPTGDDQDAESDDSESEPEDSSAKLAFNAIFGEQSAGDSS